MPSRRLPAQGGRSRHRPVAASVAAFSFAGFLTLALLTPSSSAGAAELRDTVPLDATQPDTTLPGTTLPDTTRILVIRGVFNVFSTGLDELGQELRERGYDVEVSSPGGCWAGALRLREAYERDPRGGPLVIIGHSMGGRACLHIARYLELYGIPVKLVVIVDANPWVSVPENVERCLNLYVTNSYGMFHGSPVRGAAAARVLNYDVTKIERPTWADPVDHFNIDNSPWMHTVIAGEIERAYAPWRTGQAAPRWGGNHAVARPPTPAPEQGAAGPASAGYLPGVAIPAAAFSVGFGDAAVPAVSPQHAPRAAPPPQRAREAPSPRQPSQPQQTIRIRL